MSGGFRRGGEEAQKASEQSGGLRFARTEYLKVEDDSHVVVRYLTDSPDWIFVDQHAGAVTKNKPADWPADRAWPSSMPAVCRHDPAINAGNCYICDAEVNNSWGRPCKPSVRVWALACLREEVVGTPELVAEGLCTEDQIGRRIGFVDAVRKVAEVDDKGEPTGKEVEQLAIVVVNFASNNYFGALQATYSIYGSVCDRDFVVKRTGKGKEVEYTNIALDPTPSLKPGTPAWARYDEALKEQKINLEEIIRDKASDDYYALFFDPTKTAPSRGNDKDQGSGQAAAPAPASSALDEDRLAAMKARVRQASGALGRETD